MTRSVARCLACVPGHATLCTMLLLGALLLGGSDPGAFAQGYTFGRAALATPAAATALAKGDFNGDGVADFAISSSTNGTVSIFLSRPDGSYAPRTDFSVTGATQMVAGDFNNDGKTDLAIATGSSLVVMPGNGDGTFQGPFTYGIATTALAAADFNADGKLDLVIAGTASGIYLGNGDGTFTLLGSSLGSAAYVFTADFNNDGKLDAFLGNQIFLGDGKGGLTLAASTTYSGTTPAVAADVDGDGILDLIYQLTSCQRFSCGYNFYLYKGVGNGTFTFSRTFSSGGTQSQIITADFNQDGKMDFISLPGGLYLGNGDGTFTGPQQGATGLSGTTLLAGDFNNDGQLDVAELDKNNFLSLSLGNHGVFPQPALTTVGAALGATTVFADLNNDGKPDEISVTFSQVVVQLGNGDGTFQAPQVSSANGGGAQFAVADFNHDSKPDLAIIGPGSTIQTFAVLLGNGDGTFQSPIATNGSRYALYMAAADLNGDGNLDLLVPSQNGPYGVDVYLGRGDGTFGSLTTFNTCFPGGIVVADFNHDGFADAAVACNDSGTYGMQVLLGKGDGTFQPEVFYSTGNDFSTSIVAGDFDADGRTDLAEGGFQGISVLLGNGDGTFHASTPATIGGSQPLFLTAADFNLDGKTDLAAIVYPSSLSLTHLYFSNGDGTFTDSFLSGSPSGGLVATDLNNDGAPDLLATLPGASSSTVYSHINAPVASFSPGALSFANQIVNTTSSSRTLTVSNPSSAPLALGATSVTGDFAITSNACTGTLPPAGSCTIQATFTPTATGLRTGTLTVASSNIGGTAVLTLSGTGTAAGAVVTLTPTTLTFAGQVVGTSSTAQVITVSSTGSGAATFASFSSTGDFSQTNTCPAVLSSGATCTVSVTFKPTATGTRSGSLVVSDNGVGGGQTATLSGTGTAPVVTLSPTSLTFANQLLNTTSQGQKVTLTNTGNGALTVTSLSISGTNSTEFTQTNTCGITVNVGASCTITVAFRPTAINARTATLNINDNAFGAPQTIALTGTGTNIKLSATTVNFGTVTVGQKSPVKNVTVTNSGSVTVNISGISLSGANSSDYTETTTCGATLLTRKTCTISLTFAPTVKGTRTATLNVNDDGGGSPQTAALTGSGR